MGFAELAHRLRDGLRSGAQADQEERSNESEWREVQWQAEALPHIYEIDFGGGEVCRDVEVDRAGRQFVQGGQGLAGAEAFREFCYGREHLSLRKRLMQPFGLRAAFAIGDHNQRHAIQISVGRAVHRRACPGPSVATSAPGCPVISACAAAMNAEPVSVCAREKGRPARSAAAMMSETLPPPGIPNRRDARRTQHFHDSVSARHE